jgi:hypothetical protein
VGHKKLCQQPTWVVSHARDITFAAIFGMLRWPKAGEVGSRAGTSLIVPGGECRATGSYPAVCQQQFCCFFRSFKAVPDGRSAAESVREVLYFRQLYIWKDVVGCLVRSDADRSSCPGTRLLDIAVERIRNPVRKGGQNAPMWTDTSISEMSQRSRIRSVLAVRLYRAR